PPQPRQLRCHPPSPGPKAPREPKGRLVRYRRRPPPCQPSSPPRATLPFWQEAGRDDEMTGEEEKASIWTGRHPDQGENGRRIARTPLKRWQFGAEIRDNATRTRFDKAN